MKRCRTCRQYHPTASFTPEKRSADGFGYRCKNCERARRKRDRAKNSLKWASQDPYETHPTGSKLCGGCKATKPVEDFSRNAQAGDGLQSSCKQCQIDRWHLRTYGRTLQQGGDACAICGGTENLAVDHDHATGQTRGNLCRPCNMAIGSFNDDLSLLQKAIAYLEKWS